MTLSAQQLRHWKGLANIKDRSLWMKAHKVEFTNNDNKD